MLKNAIRRRAPLSLQRHDIRIVTPREHPSVGDVFGQQIRILQPIDLAPICGPCLEGVTIQPVYGDDTI